MPRRTSYDRLKKLLTDKATNAKALGVTFLESDTVHGHSYELWATIEKNEIDTRFFVVAPGMRILHVYLSDFQELLHGRDKVVTDPVEGTVFGQAIYTFRLITASIDGQMAAALETDKQDMGSIAHKPMDALVEAVQRIGRNYRHVVLLDGQLVTGELITT